VDYSAGIPGGARERHGGQNRARLFHGQESFSIIDSLEAVVSFSQTYVKTSASR